MRFISIFTHEPTGATPGAEEIAEMGKLIEEGAKTGWLLGTEGVTWGSTGTKIRLSGGKLSVVDGPFAEAKEVVGGYALMQAKSKEEAIELCRRFLKVGGDGVCELHPLFETPALDPRGR